MKLYETIGVTKKDGHVFFLDLFASIFLSTSGVVTFFPHPTNGITPCHGDKNPLVS